MLLQHEEYQSSFDKAIACMEECEHCAEACRTAAEAYGQIVKVAVAA